MKRLALAAALAGLVAGATGCGSSGYSSTGYYVTDDGLPGCAFRYGYYPCYDASGASRSARMEIDRVERRRLPRRIDRTDYCLADRLNGGAQASVSPGDPAGSGSIVADRAPIAPPAPPPPPRVVAPRS